MPASHKVDTKWQMVFSAIFPLNIWAFYRIKKLQKFLACVIIPSIVVRIPLFYYGYYEMPRLLPNAVPILYTIIDLVVSLGFVAFSIYLAVRWSRQWNASFRAESS